MAYTTINKSSEHFNTKLYTGNVSAGRSITGVGFKPDLVWNKIRSISGNHHWYDAVRGTQKFIRSNDNTAEGTNGGTDGITAFGTDGYTIGGNTGINANNETYTSWNWKANGAGGANTDGSISSTVSANTTAGFSIVKWTGTGSASTVGHGLGVAPKMIIMKRTSGAVNDWVVYHESVGNNKALFLNAINAPDTDSAYFNDTSPTSSVFSVKSGQTNNNGDNQIAYCFAQKQGYSKFGSYIGNGNVDGTFVYTGFKPAFVMVKKTSGTGNWEIMDNKRDTYNAAITLLFPNLTNADATSYNTDFLSNGFKQRVTASSRNASGSTYIYMAFAEAPLVGTNNVPCTAR